MWKKLTKESVMLITIQDRLRGNKGEQFGVEHISIDRKIFTIIADPIVVGFDFSSKIKTERKRLSSEDLLNNQWEIFVNL